MTCDVVIRWVWSGLGFDLHKPGPDQNRTRTRPDRIEPGPVMKSVVPYKTWLKKSAKLYQPDNYLMLWVWELIPALKPAAKTRSKSFRSGLAKTPSLPRGSMPVVSNGADVVCLEGSKQQYNSGSLRLLATLRNILWRPCRSDVTGHCQH